jgi:hypothetical protein
MHFLLQLSYQSWQWTLQLPPLLQHTLSDMPLFIRNIKIRISVSPIEFQFLPPVKKNSGIMHVFGATLAIVVSLISSEDPRRFHKQLLFEHHSTWNRSSWRNYLRTVLNLAPHSLHCDQYMRLFWLLDRSVWYCNCKEALYHQLCTVQFN